MTHGTMKRPHHSPSRKALKTNRLASVSASTPLASPLPEPKGTEDMLKALLWSLFALRWPHHSRSRKALKTALFSLGFRFGEEASPLPEPKGTEDAMMASESRK